MNEAKRVIELMHEAIDATVAKQRPDLLLVLLDELERLAREQAAERMQ